VHDVDPARISDLLQDGQSLIWLDALDPTDEELALLEEEFSLPRVVMEDVREGDQRPHVEALEDAFFIAMYAFRIEGEEPVPQEIHAIVGPRFLVTLRYAPAFDIDKVIRRWKQDEADLAGEGGGFLLHPLLDEVVDSYLEVLDQLELRSEEVESVVFGDPAPTDIQARIFQEKKRLIEFRRRILPLREVLDLLQEERHVVTPALRGEYKDVADHVVRALELVDSVRELLTTALDAHLSRVGHQLNEVVKKLTSWAAIILIPTLIAGVYGMNFRHMPELDWVFGYPFALGLMLASGGLLYLLIKRRDWL
jgi:magnesium transporter